MIVIFLSLGAAASPPQTIAEAFPPPAGAVRVAHDAFGEWLVQRPLESPDVPVLTYDGRVVGHDARVVSFPLLKSGDLQQCADSVIRLRAEWLREHVGGTITFHATSGDAIPYSRYLVGERAYESGGKIRWKQVLPPLDGDRRDDIDPALPWEVYLRDVFTWAGTRSLAYDTVPVAVPAPGDLVVAPGSPGHAIVLLDVARRGDDWFVLVGEGYMPAQSFHVELGPDDGWWPWHAGVSLPSWDMPASGLRRWKPPGQ